MGKYSFLIILIAVISVLFLYLIVFLKRYIKCPPNKIMVIFGRISKDTSESVKIIHGGSVFVWPIIQDYAFLDLKPISFKLDIINKRFMHGIIVDTPLNVTVGISTDYSIVKNAAERLLGVVPEQIGCIAQDIAIDIYKNLIPKFTVGKINTSPDKFQLELKNSISKELNKIGLELIALN